MISSINLYMSEYFSRFFNLQIRQTKRPVCYIRAFWIDVTLLTQEQSQPSMSPSTFQLQERISSLLRCLSS